MHTICGWKGVAEPSLSSTHVVASSEDQDWIASEDGFMFEQENRGLWSRLAWALKNIVYLLFVLISKNVSLATFQEGGSDLPS